MKNDEYLLKLMRQVDGTVNQKADLNDTREVNDLKEILSDLKAMPLEAPNATTDQQISKFIQQNRHTNPSIKRAQWWPLVLLAASIALLIYLFLPGKLSEQYKSIEVNPEKIGFLHDLNDEKLDKDELIWLVSLLEEEDHPNIRVVLIDLIARQGHEFPKEFSGYLEKEQIPTVQMALLNSFNDDKEPEIKEALLAFNKRKDLDPLVQKRVEEILNQN